MTTLLAGLQADPTAELWRAAVLGLVQGLTEFLPISSSAHLILFPRLVGWPDQGLAFDIAANTGTLAALLVYFGRDLVQELGALGRRSAGKMNAPGWPLLLWLAVATVPVGIFGLLLSDWVAGDARNPQLIAVTSIGFGLLLWWADILASRPGFAKRDQEAALGWTDALLLGVAQAVALIPGTSRSGAVMTAGLFQRFDRPAAARLSFLMAIPVGVLVAGKDIVDLLSQFGRGDTVAWAPLVVGFLTAGVSGFLVIALLLEWLKSRSLRVFVFYRVALGIALLVLFR